MEAESEANDWGAMEITGMRCSGDDKAGLALRKARTSACDCKVMRTDSADVIQPLRIRINGVKIAMTHNAKRTYLHARQSFRLI